MEKAAKSISEISLEVDRLAGRVSAFESIISKGAKVAETDLLSLVELLMNQLLRLDGITGDGDVKLQRKMQVKRVQKYVETLDVLKVKNSNGQRIGPIKEQPQTHSNGHHRLAPIQEQQEEQPRNSNGHSQVFQQQQQSNHSTSGVVVTTKWETFDSIPPLIQVESTSTTPAVNNNNSGPPKFNWELFN
uniref:BAG domain-containing protein n=1 Tax=Lotus japonicus TaxID=34305 RepID=I3S879_LOTJA|nr:unknown [Lotus japonicus]